MGPRFKGYLAEELLGRHFSRFYTEEDRAAERPARALRTWRVRKDDARFWAHVVIDPIRDESGALVGCAKITPDLTERKEAEGRPASPHHQQTQGAGSRPVEEVEALGCFIGEVEVSRPDSTVGKILAAGPSGTGYAGRWGRDSGSLVLIDVRLLISHSRQVRSLEVLVGDKACSETGRGDQAGEKNVVPDFPPIEAEHNHHPK